MLYANPCISISIDESIKKNAKFFLSFLYSDFITNIMIQTIDIMINVVIRIARTFLFKTETYNKYKNIINTILETDINFFI